MREHELGIIYPIVILVFSISPISTMTTQPTPKRTRSHFAGKPIFFPFYCSPRSLTARDDDLQSVAG
ncbi:hypothetical protein JAAARDRAFT_432619 [Jaapia argillacea MUCL 33604]|uniref:Uncharacterized protein n=1 Tax=Jaapia argillacea MUCL 33604 TaxID=933084 RepID=A0A067PPU4_9AGAM|nr:hypothetical protein JAAARDRAFT_432619 [Jaapia argillacea MUCL 33604]